MAKGRFKWADSKTIWFISGQENPHLFPNLAGHPKAINVQNLVCLWISPDTLSKDQDLDWRHNNEIRMNAFTIINIEPLVEDQKLPTISWCISVACVQMWVLYHLIGHFRCIEIDYKKVPALLLSSLESLWLMCVNQFIDQFWSSTINVIVIILVLFD